MSTTFLCYCGRSGSTWLARLMSERFHVVVVPEFRTAERLMILGRLPKRGEFSAIYAADPQLEWLGEPRGQELLSSAESRADFIRSIGRDYAARVGASDDAEIVFKWGGAILFVDELRRDDPKAEFVYIVRDARAVCHSLLKTGRPHQGGKITLANDDPVRAIEMWRSSVRAALRAVEHHPGVVSLARYEDLVQDSEHVLSRLGDERGWSRGGVVTFEPDRREQAIHPRIQRPAVASAMSEWQSALRPWVERTVTRRCVAELETFRYSTVRKGGWVALCDTVRARVLHLVREVILVSRFLVTDLSWQTLVFKVDRRARARLRRK